MTTRTGYKAIFVHADAETLTDIEILKSELPKGEAKKLSISDVVRIALRFTAAKLSEKKMVATA